MSIFSSSSANINNSLQSKFTSEQWAALRHLPFYVFGWAARAEARQEPIDGTLTSGWVGVLWSIHRVRAKEMLFQHILLKPAPVVGPSFGEICTAGKELGERLQLMESAVEDALDPFEDAADIKRFGKLLASRLAPDEYQEAGEGMLRLVSFLGNALDQRSEAENKKIQARQNRDHALLEAMLKSLYSNHSF
jgi:hypothetical protein